MTDATQDGANRRRHERKKARYNAALIVDGDRHDCLIEDISPGGAKLVLDRYTPSGVDAVLSLGKLGDYPVTVAWARGGATGVQFLIDSDEAQRLVMAIAFHGTG